MSHSPSIPIATFETMQAEVARGRSAIRVLGALTVVGRIRVEAVPTGEAPIAAAVEAAADRVAAVAGLQVHPADASA